MAQRGSPKTGKCRKSVLVRALLPATTRDNVPQEASASSVVTQQEPETIGLTH